MKKEENQPLTFPINQGETDAHPSFEWAKEATPIIREADILSPVEVDEQPDGSSYFNVSNSAAINGVRILLGSGDNLKGAAAKKQAISRGSSYTVTHGKGTNSKRTKMDVKSQTGEYSIIVNDIETIFRSRKALQKLFVFFVSEVNRQALKNGFLTRSQIVIPLQEFVDKGLYKTVRSARNALSEHLSEILSFQIGGSVKRGKNIVKSALAVLFPTGIVESSSLYLDVNEAIGWSYFTAFITIMPNYYYSLPSRAGMLLWSIMSAARQNTKAIKDKGYFTLKVETLALELGLPAPDKVKDQRRDILQPVIDAVEEINHAEASLLNDMSLELVYDTNASVTNFLNKGYIKVNIRGNYAARFTGLATQQETEIEKKKQLKERMQAARLCKTDQTKKE